ncbi:MAG: PBP1A family penicillin-binding protein [Pyrinomonadaceae bacterium]
MLRNTSERAVAQGGSTITQQLVKNTYLTPERSLKRKFNEAVLASVLERRLSKEEIFALYCNEIYLGQRGTTAVRGVGQAARVYFAKNLQDLNLAEAATIAGMIQSPNRHAPDRHPESSLARRNTVIGAMLRDGFITAQAAEQAIAEGLAVAPLDTVAAAAAPYFLDYVNRSIEAELDVTNSDAPDLRVYTTLELELQHLAESVVKDRLAKLDKVHRKKDVAPQAALVAIDPHTGHVLAMVGGRNYSESQLNRVTDARRQPGSVFKPIVYAAAMESGASPLSVYQDAPRVFTYDGRRQYKPANYGGGYSMHDVTMRTALARSLNVVTVDIALRAGLARVASLAEKFGLPRPEPYPALALGTTETTPLEVASAYTAFANNGNVVNPIVITKAADSAGNIIVSQAAPDARRVIRPDTAFMVTGILEDVIKRGTARAARSSVKGTAIAGKTGTSRDGWFVGYTPNLVCAMWVGFDDNDELGLTGAEAALPAWVDFMKGAVDLRPELGGAAFTRPAGMVTVEIDSETGMLASPACPARERVALSNSFAPQYTCLTHNQPLELLAEAEITEVVDSSSAAPIAIDAATAQPTTTAQPLAPALPPAPQTAESASEVPTVIKASRIEVNESGRRVLINDMRISGASNQSP